MFKRRAFKSQNFLRDPKLVSRLVGKSSIGIKDVVIEIGPGTGIITSELLQKAGKVIAVELDTNLYNKVKFKFTDNDCLKLYNQDFRRFVLPNIPYKVFSNIPFSITSDVIRKLTSDDNFQEGYLVVQKEAAQKFIGKPLDSKNQMAAIFLKPWFDIRMFWRFNRYDFVPKPGVNVVMIQITRKRETNVAFAERNLYQDFIIYSYNRERYSYKNYKEILDLYKIFKISNKRAINRIRKKAQKIKEKQKDIKKIHRTRKDKHWRRY